MRRVIAVALAIGLVGSFVGLALAANQPHMESALRALENAQREISIADQANDHGGHAGAATNLIAQAIREVEEGIRFRNMHGP